MLIFHTDSKILFVLNEDNESLAGEHIKNGYSGMLEEWRTGTIRATKLESTSSDTLVIDSGKPRLMTDDEIKQRTIELEASLVAQKEKLAYEAKIQTELRDIAIKSLSAKEVK